MFSKITQRLLSSKRFIAISLIATILIFSSFVILINQRSLITNNNFTDELLILISAIFIIIISIIFTITIYRVIIPINKRKINSFSNRFSLYFISIALSPAIVAGIADVCGMIGSIVLSLFSGFGGYQFLFGILIIVACVNVLTTLCLLIYVKFCKK